MLKKILIAVTLVASAAPAAANEWVPLGLTDDGNGAIAVRADRQILNGEGMTIRRAWAWIVYDQPQDGVQQMKALMEFNCRQWTMRIIQTSITFRDGVSNNGPFEGGAEYIYPGSMGEIAATAVCEWDK